MRCGYMILTFILGLAFVSPALLAVRAIFMGSFIEPQMTPLGFMEAVGWVQWVALAAASVIHGWLAECVRRAKAELDALKAGMRGEG